MKPPASRQLNHHRQSGFVLELTVLVVGLLIFILAIVLMFAFVSRIRLWDGENVVGADRAGEASSVSQSNCPDDVLQVIRNNRQILNRISENSIVYKRVAEQQNIPWEVLASIHYREHSNNPTNPSNGQGPYQLESLHGAIVANGGSTMVAGRRITLNDIQQFISATEVTAFVLEKVYLRSSLTSTPSDETVKKAFLYYNAGPASSMQPDDSSYVMNNFDQEHYHMRIRGTVDHGRVRVDGVDTRDGAFTVYYLLRYLAIYDSTGRITGFKDCQPTAGSTDVINQQTNRGEAIATKAEGYVGQSTYIDPVTGENVFKCNAPTRSCASFVSTVLNETGVTRIFERTTTALWNNTGGKVIVDRGGTLDLNLLTRGDVVWFGLGNTARYSGALFNHVGIYVGDGMIVDTSSTTKQVVKRSITTHSGSNRFTAAKRF